MSEKTETRFRSGFAALVGRANVGKSTLLNRLVGEKVAIVSPVPQTTRNRIVGVRRVPSGQVAFIDSPGFHKAQHRLGDVLVEAARSVAAEADVVVFVVDASTGLGPGDRFVRDVLADRIGRGEVLLVLNKIDTMNKGKVLPLIEQAVAEWGITDAIPVSAASGANCDHLLETIVARLPEGPALFPDDFVTDQSERRMIAEIVREKLLERTRQEVPHSIAVLIERMESHTAEGETPEGEAAGLLDIDAAIVVERESQKGIVIGHKGKMLKEVGTLARKDIERLLGRRVYLRLWVKVREDWRDRLTLLRELGMFPE